MKWYHEWREEAMEQYQTGYYPRHSRTPNLLVCGLYKLGYLIADFGPMCVNLFDAIYTNIRKLFAFIVGLLIELSTVIILIGTIAFSIVHSIELLRRAGATGGLEYVGVVMFEVVFISSTASLTGTLMKKKKPSGFFSIAGLMFSIAGFIMGIAFVEWSNITGMADNLTGRIIGGATPVLLIISEGVLAFRYLNEFAEEDETRVMEIIQRNRMTVEDVRRAIQLYLNQKSDSQTGSIGQLQSDTQIGQQKSDNQTIIRQSASDTFGQSDNEEPDNQTESIGHPDTKTGQSDKDESDSQTEQVGQSDTTNGQSESDNQSLVNPSNSPTDETIGQSDTHERTVENQTFSSEQIGQKMDDPKSDSEEIGHTPSDTFKQSDTYIGQTKSDSDSDTHIRQKENQTPDSNRTTGQSDKKTDTSKKEKKSDKVVQFKKKKSDKQTRGLSDEEIKKMAEEFKSENGKLPSIRKLAELASCSKYKAEKAINELREAQ